jgi:hypothetical protein
VTQRHSKFVDEANSYYSINGACQSNLEIRTHPGAWPICAPQRDWQRAFPRFQVDCLRVFQRTAWDIDVRSGTMRV